MGHIVKRSDMLKASNWLRNGPAISSYPHVILSSMLFPLNHAASGACDGSGHEAWFQLYQN